MQNRRPHKFRCSDVVLRSGLSPGMQSAAVQSAVFSLPIRTRRARIFKDMRANRVYQRGPSRPARAMLVSLPALPPSVSKRPFPTSQSPISKRCFSVSECIKEALPDQPEHRK